MSESHGIGCLDAVELPRHIRRARDRQSRRTVSVGRGFDVCPRQKRRVAVRQRKFLRHAHAQQLRSHVRDPSVRLGRDDEHHGAGNKLDALDVERIQGDWVDNGNSVRAVYGGGAAAAVHGEAVVAVRQPEVDVAVCVGIEVARAVAVQSGELGRGVGRANRDDDGVQDAPGGVVRQVRHGAIALREALLLRVEVGEDDVAARDDDGDVVVVGLGVGQAVADVGGEDVGVLASAAGVDGAAGDFDEAAGVGLRHPEGSADGRGGVAVFRAGVGVDPAAGDAVRRRW